MGCTSSKSTKTSKPIKLEAILGSKTIQKPSPVLDTKTSVRKDPSPKSSATTVSRNIFNGKSKKPNKTPKIVIRNTPKKSQKPMTAPAKKTLATQTKKVPSKAPARKRKRESSPPRMISSHQDVIVNSHLEDHFRMNNDIQNDQARNDANNDMANDCWGNDAAPGFGTHDTPADFGCHNAGNDFGIDIGGGCDMGGGFGGGCDIGGNDFGGGACDNGGGCDMGGGMGCDF